MADDAVESQNWLLEGAGRHGGRYWCAVTARANGYDVAATQKCIAKRTRGAARGTVKPSSSEYASRSVESWVEISRR